MTHPNAEDYIKAAQHPDTVFANEGLKTARFDTHPLLGFPVPAAGTSAVVFKAAMNGSPVALRFFTREDVSTRERYTALQEFVRRNGLGDHVVAAQWIDDAVTVRGRTWPVVRMDWVDGRPLDQHVEDLVAQRDTTALGALATAWRELIKQLQTARFAHGDLQHGNVLVDRHGALRLVDLDGAWIEPFAGTTSSTEVGHRHYQPPGRQWGPWMDTFPGLVIYLSLLALAGVGDPTRPWEELYIGDNLLFQQEDFQPPHRTAVWQRVAGAADPRLDALADTLKSCCAPGWTASGGLEALLDAGPPWWLRARPGADPAPAPQPPSASGQAKPPPPPPFPPQSPFVGPPAGPPASGPGGGPAPWWAATRPPATVAPGRPPAPTDGGNAGSDNGQWKKVALVVAIVLALITVAVLVGQH